MENDIMESLKDLGYEGPLTEEIPFTKAIEGGPKSLEFTKLVHILAEELKQLCNLEETVNMMNDPEECSSFLLELSSFLKELGCPYKKLITGFMSSRLQTKEDCILLLDYLISELMAARMVNVDCPKEKAQTGMEIVPQESQTAKDLKDILIALKLNKPPPNVNPEMLFSKLETKLKETIQKEGQQVVGKPLYNKAVSEKEWRELETAFNEMFEEYRCRRETLITRLECTIQSFEWSERLKDKRDAIQSTYVAKRGQLKTKPAVRASELLAARTSLLLVEKTSSASTRRNTQTHVNKVIIGHVPDRGGRPNEQQPPPPEMPSWQPRITPPGGGVREWRGGWVRFNSNGGWNYNDVTRLYPQPMQQRQRVQTFTVPPGRYNQGYSHQGYKATTGYGGRNQNYSKDLFGECSQVCQQQTRLSQVGDQSSNQNYRNDESVVSGNVNEIENSYDSIKDRSEEIKESCEEVNKEKEIVIMEGNRQDRNETCEENMEKDLNGQSQDKNQNQKVQSDCDVGDNDKTNEDSKTNDSQGCDQGDIESERGKQDLDPPTDNVANSEPIKQVREIVYENMEDYDNESENEGVNVAYQSDDELFESCWHDDVNEEHNLESDNECKIYQANTVDVVEVESSDDESQNSGDKNVETTLGKRACTSSASSHDMKRAKLETIIQKDNQTSKDLTIDSTVDKNISEASKSLFNETEKVHESIAKANNPSGSKNSAPTTDVPMKKKHIKKARKLAKRVAWWTSRGKSEAEANALAVLPINRYPEYKDEMKALKAQRRAAKKEMKKITKTEVPKKETFNQELPTGSHKSKEEIRLGIVNVKPMCIEELNILQYQLLALAAKEEWGKGPDLRNLKFKMGAMVLTCMNEASRQWLNQHVTSSWQPFKGAKLSIVNHKSLNRPKYGTLWFPNLLLSGEEILKLLSHLNSGINFKLWGPVATRQVKNGQFVTFAVDFNSYNTLAKRGFVLKSNYRDLIIVFKGC